MPRYQFGRFYLETLNNLTLDEARAFISAIADDERQEEQEARLWEETATADQLEGARLLAEKWEEDALGAHFVGPPTTEIVLVETSWEHGAILERYNVGGYRAWAEPGLTQQEVEQRIAAVQRRASVADGASDGDQER